MVVISDIKSNWKPGTVEYPRIVLRPVLLSIFVNDLNGRARKAFSKLANNAKLGRVLHTPECCATI